MVMSQASTEETPISILGRRIVIIGMTASGKSTLAGQLARLLAVPHVELDSIVNGANWVDVSNEEFHARAAEALNGDGWVVDGNYRVVRDLTIGQADTVIWLDYMIVVPLWRVIPRTLRRIVQHEELWNGNRETWRGAFFSRDSLFLWILTKHRSLRREFTALFDQREHTDRTIIHFRSPRATERWRRRLTDDRAGLLG